MAVANQTVIIGQVKAAENTAESLSKLINRPLGSPINGYKVGQQFTVTLTGVIEIRSFNQRKTAYFLTVEGISVAVNASFNPAIHVNGYTADCICREISTVRDGKEVMIKYASFDVA